MRRRARRSSGQPLFNSGELLREVRGLVKTKNQGLALSMLRVFVPVILTIVVKGLLASKR